MRIYGYVRLMVGWFDYISRCNGMNCIKAFIMYWQVCLSHKLYVVFFVPETYAKLGYWKIWFCKIYAEYDAL
jgi:hypothetical protein